MAMLQITVEYSRQPPQIFVQWLRRFCLDRQNSPNCEVALDWMEATIASQQPFRQPPAYHGGTSIIITDTLSRSNVLHSTDTHVGII